MPLPSGARTASSAATRSAVCWRAWGVDDPAALEFLRTNPSARHCTSCVPASRSRSKPNAAGRLITLHFVTGDGAQLSITRDGERISAASSPAPIEVRWGDWRRARYARRCTALRMPQGCPTALTQQMADVFGGDIDFYQDLRRGDRFTIVYEMRYVDGESIGARPQSSAAEFEKPRPRGFARFSGATRRAAKTITTDDGAPLRKAFIRSPMEFSRVTSGFSGARFHPIHGTWRAHRGCRLRSAARHADTRHGQRQGRVRRPAGRVRQRDRIAAPRRVFDALCAFVAFSRRRSGGRSRGARRGHRLRRANGLGDRTSSALRISRRARGAQSGPSSFPAANRSCPGASGQFATRHRGRLGRSSSSPGPFPDRSLRQASSATANVAPRHVEPR